MEALAHPVLLVGSAFVSALAVLGIVFVVGQAIGRRKWKKIKKFSMGHTVTVEYGSTRKEK